jgi:hypothetical protein
MRSEWILGLDMFRRKKKTLRNAHAQWAHKVGNKYAQKKKEVSAHVLWVEIRIRHAQKKKEDTAHAQWAQKLGNKHVQKKLTHSKWGTFFRYYSILIFARKTNFYLDCCGCFVLVDIILKKIFV